MKKNLFNLFASKKTSKIHVWCVNKTNLINILIGHDIKVKNLITHENGIEFLTSKLQVSKIKQILTNHNLKFVVKNNNLFATGFLLITAIILPIIMYCACSVILSGFIFKLDVKCDDEKVKQNIINTIQNETGLSFYSKTSTDFDSLKHKIYAQNNEVSFCSLSCAGNTLIVNVKLKLSNSEYVQKDCFESIISPVTGYIEEIEITQGTVCVSRGDLIEKGEVIVGAYIIDGNGNKIAIEPRARIKIRAFECSKRQVGERSLEYVRTGNYCKDSEIQLCGLTIFKNSQEVSFDNFECEENHKFIAPNNLLPIKLIEKYYYETTAQNVVFDVEAEKEDVFRALHEDAKNKLPQNVEIVDEKRNLKNSAGVFDFEVVIEYYLNIS